METTLLVVLFGMALAQILSFRKIFKMFDAYESRQLSTERWTNTVREDVATRLDEFDLRLRAMKTDVEKNQLEDYKALCEQIDVIKKRIPAESAKQIPKRGAAKKRRN